MQMSRSILLILSLLATPLLSGCISGNSPTSSLTYPATANVFITFQEEKVLPQCKVFSHKLVTTPAGLTGKQVQEEVIGNAKSSGADMILVGLARESFEEDLEEYIFTSYGPTRPYNFQKYWSGWKYGFKDWNDGGEIVSFGFTGWNDNKNPYHHGLMLQTVYLTCQIGPSKPQQ